MAALTDAVANNLFAKAAVEVAMHDAWARALGVPVHTLLGGLARTSIPVTWALGTESAEVVADEALAKLDAGLHHSFKLKMGPQEPAADVARVAAVAEKLCGSAGVRVDPYELLPAVHRVASLVKRWLLGTHQGSVDPAHLPGYLNEFVFRFNRRRAGSRGLLFYRVLELAVAHDPVRYRDLVAASEPTATPPIPPGARGAPPTMDRPPAARPWRAADQD